MPLAYGKVLDDPTLAAIGARLGANPAQEALAWSLAKGYAAIPSSTQRANLAAAQLVLASKDIAAIDALERGERLVSPDFAPDWD
jgi:2,5-diketo-D-gluconate reductase B